MNYRTNNDRDGDLLVLLVSIFALLASIIVSINP